jgi:hypothetical protein
MSRRGRGGNPISLFSFQDIITSVTGIMILVTLFLGLEIMRRREQSPAHQTQSLAEEIQQAAAQSGQVEAAVAANRRQIDELRNSLVDEEGHLLEDVKYDPEQLERQLRDLTALNHMLEQEVTESDSRRQAAERSLADLAARADSRAAERQSLDRLIQQAQQKKHELDKLRQANRVIFNPDQASTKTPWLVELSPQRILAGVVGKKQPPQSFANVQTFLAWATQRKAAGEYFVLLIKPEAVHDFTVARAALEKAGFDLGYDLLKADHTAVDPQQGAAAP